MRLGVPTFGCKWGLKYSWCMSTPPFSVWRLGFILSATHLVIALNTTFQIFLQTSNLPYFKACLLCKIRKEQCFGTDVSFPLSCHSKFHFTWYISSSPQFPASWKFCPQPPFLTFAAAKMCIFYQMLNCNTNNISFTFFLGGGGK